MSKITTFLHLLHHDRKGLASAIAGNFSRSRLSHLLSDKAYINYMYKVAFGKKPNLEAPKTFNEKLQWLKLYNRKPEYCDLVDKYEVKKYIAEIIGEQYVIPTLGVWDSFDDIDFDALPDRFVLKCTHDSGSVVLCRDKATFDVEKAREKLTRKLKSNLFWHGREWPYKDLKPRIIAEQYMENGTDKDLNDYKFYCFNGEPKFLYVSQGLSDHATAHISYVSMDWEKQPFKRNDFADFAELPPKPLNFEQMMELAKTLSANIPFLRVDFYDINGKLYFGELTFFPGAGFTAFDPPEWDEKIGAWITLPPKTEN